jgi:hypothetical protein
MELLETNDPKSELLRKAAKHRLAIDSDVEILSENAKRTLTNALIIGGTLTATYLLAKALTGSSTKKKKRKYIKQQPLQVVREEAPEVHVVEPERAEEKNGIMSQIGSLLASQAGIFLIGLAKEKLSEFLNSNTEGETTEEKEEATS